MRSSAVSVVLQLLGATAAVGALMTFVGGAMLWIRFDELRLPADQAVTLLPTQLLLILGAHSLAVPVGVGIFAALVFVLINALDSGNHAWPRWLALGVLVAPLAVIAFVLVEPYHVWPEWIITVGAVIVAAAVLVAAVLADAFRVLPWVVFAAFAVCGAVVAVMRTTGAPEMEPVAVLLKGTPSGVGGFYIGQTSDRLYVAPLPGTGDPGDPFADADIDRVMEINRDSVRQLALREPTGVRSDEPGREQAQSMLEDLRVLVAGAPSPAPQVITTADPVTAFAPLVHLHSKEDLWPMTADDFLDNSWLAWAHDDGCRDWTPGGRHVNAASELPGAKGGYDQTRLAGPRPYVHTRADRRCRDVGAGFKASDHTRPYDRSGRPAGLELREGFYLDLDDKLRKGTKRVKQEGPQAIFGPIPAYYERHADEANRRPGLRITYWLFYGLSRPPGAQLATRRLVHEGDWERVSVLLARAERAGQYVPLSVRYHAHDGSRDVPWSAVKRVGTAGSDASTHPVVFSARGSHASYWRAGRYENVFSTGGRERFAVFDAAISCPRCPQWRTWEALLDAQVQPWYGFGGAWGAVGSNGGFTGPLGPSTYKAGGLSPAPETTVRQSRAPVSTQPPSAPESD